MRARPDPEAPRCAHRARKTPTSPNDHFRKDATDEEWIPRVADRGWVILAADKHLLHVPGELAAVMCRGPGFSTWSGGMQGRRISRRAS